MVARLLVNFELVLHRGHTGDILHTVHECVHLASQDGPPQRHSAMIDRDIDRPWMGYTSGEVRADAFGQGAVIRRSAAGACLGPKPKPPDWTRRGRRRPRRLATSWVRCIIWSRTSARRRRPCWGSRKYMRAAPMPAPPSSRMAWSMMCLQKNSRPDPCLSALVGRTIRSISRRWVLQEMKCCKWWTPTGSNPVKIVAIRHEGRPGSGTCGFREAPGLHAYPTEL